MADQHYGYPGSVNSAAWATLAPNVGAAQYSVGGVNDCKVVGSTHADRGIEIKPGVIAGDGILDIFESSTFMAIPSVASGPDRWDMIVLRRTWNPTAGLSTSVFTIITGGQSKSLPARNNAKGTLADQPIALVRVKSGSSVIQEFIDLRVWAHNGGAHANHDLVKSYLDDVGTVLTIGTTSLDNTEWHRGVDKDGAAYWRTNNQAPLYGSSGHTWGGPLPANAPALIQAGSSVLYTDFSGYGRITWPKPFPNGNICVTLTNGDSWAVGTAVWFTVEGRGTFWGNSGGGGPVDVVYSAWGWREGAIRLMPNLLHRINWVAIGW